MMSVQIPRIPLGAWLEAFTDNMVEWCSGATRAFSTVAGNGIDMLESLLGSIPPWAFIPVVALLAWRATRKPGIGAFALLGFGLIWNLGLWEATMSTIALVLVATALAVVTGVPLGIAAAVNVTVRKVLMPVLDLMQTMPAFVYLIPAIPFFGLGKVVWDTSCALPRICPASFPATCASS